ncbi:unnamed protein product, partial [Discosporangium mesarthrocarpum]
APGAATGEARGRDHHGGGARAGKNRPGPGNGSGGLATLSPSREDSKEQGAAVLTTATGVEGASKKTWAPTAGAGAVYGCQYKDLLDRFHGMEEVVSCLEVRCVHTEEGVLQLRRAVAASATASASASASAAAGG